MALGETDSTLQTLTGSMCPRCRHRGDNGVGGRLVRCPRHPNTVLVSPHAVAASDGDPFLGACIAGRFAVLELLGAGSMGTVYRARQEAMGRDVALKIVRSDRLSDSQAKIRFQREAHAMSLLESPYTVTVFDFGELAAVVGDPPALAGSLYLAMELLEGESIGERISRLGRLEPGDALTVLKHALASLTEAHEKGIIHRDLKPDNLLITRTGSGQLRSKVLDFGIAKMLTSDGRVDVLETQAGTVFGTPRYMSPEQAQGKTLDARSDLYALGVILFHMLVGRPPFADDDAVVVMAHHIKTMPPRPTEVAPELRLPIGLEDLLMRVLEKDPARRPQSAFAFADELERLHVLTADNSGTLTASAHTPTPSRRRRAVVLGGVAAGGLALLLAGSAAQRFFATDQVSSGVTPAFDTAELVPPPRAATADPVSSGSTANDSPNAAASPVESTHVAPTVSAVPKPTQVPFKKRGYTKFDR